MVHERLFHKGDVIARKIIVSVKVNDELVKDSSTYCGPLRVWTPSGNGTIRINFNATFNPSLFSFAAETMVRDSSGSILTSMSVVEDQVATPFTVEASTRVHAVRLGISLGLRNVEVEGDS